MPLLRCELSTVLGKYQRRGKVPVEALLEAMEAEDLSSQDDKSGRGHKAGEADSFGKSVYKKLCALRSARDDSASTLRKALLDHDKDGVGKVSKRDLQRVLDRNANFTDPEAALLEENLMIVESSDSGRDRNGGYVGYPLLLLLLREPLSKAAEAVTAGTAFLNKVTRSSGNNREAVRRIFQLLYRNFSSSDRDLLGVITMDAAEDVLKQEVPSLDDKVIDTLFDAFADTDSNDCLVYPELWSFLVQCHEQSVMTRIGALDAIRHKQGYSTGDALSKLNKKKKKVDRSTASTILINLGVLVPECAIATVFNSYSTDKAKSVLNVDSFVDTIEAGGAKGGDEGDFSASAMRRRKEGADFDGNKDIKSFVSRDGGVTTCDISAKILADYDMKLTKMVQMAFDMFDSNNDNSINEKELERVMCALGYELDYAELDDLMDVIDSKNTGALEYHAFMNGVLGFIRDKYSDIVTITEKKMKEFFYHMDADRSGCLDRAEFLHITFELRCELTEEETEALIEYLDRDASGTVTWSEFSHLCDLFNDDRTVNSFNKTLRSAIRKIQYSTLPDPRKYITMFSGLPDSYRKSVLAGLDNDPVYGLDSIMTAPVSPAPETTLPGNDADGRRAGARSSSRGAEFEQNTLPFEVSVLGVNGVPYEESFRSPDVISKGVRFCVVQTNKPPSMDGPGNPPLYLSNVFQIGAMEKEGHRDMWTFKPPDGSERSCFVRCAAKDAYEHPEDTTNAAASAGTGRRRNAKDPTDELYLFMELVTTFKVNPNLNVGRKGVVKGDVDKKDKARREEVKDPAKDTTSTGRGYFGFGASSNTDKNTNKPTWRSKNRWKKKSRRPEEDGDDDDDEPTEQDEGPERGGDRSPSPDSRPRRDREDLENATYDGDVPTVEMSCGFAMINIYDAYQEAQQRGSAGVRLSRPIM